jgi:hypothetical protein
MKTWLSTTRGGDGDVIICVEAIGVGNFRPPDFSAPLANQRANFWFDTFVTHEGGIFF